MKLTIVVNVRNTAAAAGRPVVYIGRAGHGQSGYFGNPLMIGRDGTRDEVITKYRKYFAARLAKDPEFKARIHALRGAALACFCCPSACHGDVIAEYLNQQL